MGQRMGQARPIRRPITRYASLVPGSIAPANEFLDVRNWTFHNAQSLLVASKEAAEKNIPDELKGFAKIIPQLNPVIIRKVDRYELLMLVSLICHTKKRIEQFEMILSNMQSDYQEMYDSIKDKPLMMTASGFSSKVQYWEQHVTSQITDYQSDVAQISMAIQKSKYDGTDKTFKKWVVRFDDTTSETEDQE